MYPILLQIDPFTFYSLWVFLALGFFLALIIINKLSKKRLIKLSFLAQHSLLIFLSGLVASRLVFLARNFQDFFHEINFNKVLEIFFIWDKGLSIWGALIGIFISIFFLAKKEKENFAAWSDIIVTSIMGGMIFSNIGAFLDGRNYGKPTTLPWGVIIESSQYAIPIHPTQLYAAIYSLIITIILLQLFNNPLTKKDGVISMIGVFLYCLMRFLEEFLRGDESNWVFFLREAQIYCLIGLVISSYALYKQFKKNKETIL